jgi:hypothetical protein
MPSTKLISIIVHNEFGQVQPESLLQSTPKLIQTSICLPPKFTIEITNLGVGRLHEPSTRMIAVVIINSQIVSCLALSHLGSHFTINGKRTQEGIQPFQYDTSTTIKVSVQVWTCAITSVLKEPSVWPVNTSKIVADEYSMDHQFLQSLELKRLENEPMLVIQMIHTPGEIGEPLRYTTITRSICVANWVESDFYGTRKKLQKSISVPQFRPMVQKKQSLVNLRAKVKNLNVD